MNSYPATQDSTASPRARCSRHLLVWILGLSISSCSLSSSESELPFSQEWLIQKGEVFDGGPGKDGIPSIDRPVFRPVQEVDYVRDDRLVVGVRMGDVVRAYPHQVLDWHEIVNDRHESDHVGILYCPLTGTGMVWDRMVDGDVTEFGVSGLLFRNNLIAYDRRTNSLWSQMQQRSVNGSRAGASVRHLHAVETTWKTWRTLFPDSDVLVPAQMNARNYGGFAYGRSYLTEDARILFPVRHPDGRLPNKQRVHGVIGSSPADDSVRARVYVIDDFAGGVDVIEDTVGGLDYLIVGSSGWNFATAFESVLSDGSRPAMSAVQDALPIVLRDEEGNQWDLFGVAVAGPRAGQRLIPARSYTGYWFAWADFFPRVEIFRR